MPVDRVDRISRSDYHEPLQWEQDNAQERSNAYLKKHAATPLENVQPSIYASSISSLNSNVQPIKTDALSAPLKKKDVGVLDNAVGWIKDKWNGFLKSIGINFFVTDPTTRERSAKAKILDRHSPLDIEDDFKYLDITTMDPLKVMLAILVRQGELREEQAFLVQQKVLLMQEDLKDLHLQRMELKAELALISKREGVIEKVTIGVTAAEVVSGLISTAAVVAGAATIATGGAAAPFLVVTGILGGVVAGAQAITTWIKGDTKAKLDKLQGEMVLRNGKRDECQFQMKIDVKDMKKILNSLTGHAEIGSTILSAQYGK